MNAAHEVYIGGSPVVFAPGCDELVCDAGGSGSEGEESLRMRVRSLWVWVQYLRM